MNALVAAAAGVYLLFVLAMWVLQERLIFYPQPAVHETRLPAGWHAEPVRFPTPDGFELVGILASPPHGDGSAVMYLGGNAEEVTSAAREADRLYGSRAVLLVNYRGYGASGGRPSETALVQDAVALLDWLAARPGIDPRRIAVHGRSMGSGVAVQLAAARPVRCVVLTSPFDSMVRVASEAYPWLPVAWLMRHPFDSAARAERIEAPVLILVGAGDTLVRPARSEALASRWRGPVERHTYAGYGHGDVDQAPGYDASVRAFLDGHLRPP
ncbi:MAG TPA: alpha/beta fold hydrolase [Usitatibacter sp.]|nr:alpha/beta fold hydrolase [Usitatibacter sp.]